MPQPWERQSDESDQAYVAFLLFRDIGPARSLDAAYQKHRGADGGAKRAPGTWRRWYGNHRWPRRAIEWDNHQRKAADNAITRTVAKDAAARTRQQIREERRLQHRESAFGLGRLLIRRAIEALQVLDPATMDMRDTTAAGRLGDLLVRGAIDMPLEAVPDEAQGLGDEMFYETSGQLEADAPPGSLPEMPADTHVKPDLTTSIDDNATKTPDPRNRLRPQP